MHERSLDTNQSVGERTQFLQRLRTGELPLDALLGQTGISRARLAKWLTAPQFARRVRTVMRRLRALRAVELDLAAMVAPVREPDPRKLPPPRPPKPRKLRRRRVRPDEPEMSEETAARDREAWRILTSPPAIIAQPPERP